MSTLTTIIQHSLGSPTTAIREDKEIKGIQIGIQKYSLEKESFADDMILHIENPKNATRKLLELINESGKVAVYKIKAKKISFIPIH